jgi:nitrogen regulatory protein PII
MKRIEAVITPSTLDSFREAATRLGISEFELVEVYRLGCESVEEASGLYRGSEYRAELSPRLRVEFVMFDDDVQKTLHRLLQLIHPESISVFRLDQEVRTIPSTRPGANSAFSSCDLMTTSEPRLRSFALNGGHTDRGRGLVATGPAPIRH